SSRQSVGFDARLKGSRSCRSVTNRCSPEGSRSSGVEGARAFQASGMRRGRQNIYRRLSCASRRSAFLLMTRPKFPFVGSTSLKPDVVDVPATLLQFGRLMKLKISARNCRRCVPLTLKFLKNAMSHCCSEGLYQAFRGALPKVPADGAANAAGLNQKF